jgi:hypothetical protein
MNTCNPSEYLALWIQLSPLSIELPPYLAWSLPSLPPATSKPTPTPDWNSKPRTGAEA